MSGETTEIPFPSSLYMLIQRAGRMGKGPARVKLCEEAVRLADTHQDEDLGFYARQHLIRAATFAGYPERALTAFAWCLARSDREPARFPLRAGGYESLLWMYKWMPTEAAKFPNIPRARIEQTIADLSVRVRSLNLSQRPVRVAELDTAMCFYEPGARLLELREAFLREPRDSFSDCRACELHSSVRALLMAGRLDEAWEEAQPLLRGELGCEMVPHVTYGALLMPLWDAGRLDDAAFCFERCYELSKDRKVLLEEVSLCAEHMALTGRTTEAVEAIERFASWADGSYDLNGVMRYHAAAGSVLAQAVRESGDDPLGLILPAFVPEALLKGPTTALVAWFDAQADAIAARFDARNGTNGNARTLQEARTRLGR